MEEKKAKINGSFWTVFSNRNISGHISPKSNTESSFLLFLKKSRGFTLIELLVVIAIISILSGLLITALNPSLQLMKSRDSRRKSDLKIIQSALELYRSDQDSYPATEGNSVVNCTSSNSFSRNGTCDSSDTIYLQSVPVDPVFQSDYYYCADTSCGAPSGGYVLYSCLGNANDIDRLDSGSTNPSLPSSSVQDAMGCPSGSVYYGVVNP